MQSIHTLSLSVRGGISYLQCSWHYVLLNGYMPHCTWSGLMRTSDLRYSCDTDVTTKAHRTPTLHPNLMRQSGRQRNTEMSHNGWMCPVQCQDQDLIVWLEASTAFIPLDMFTCRQLSLLLRV